MVTQTFWLSCGAQSLKQMYRDFRFGVDGKTGRTAAPGVQHGPLRPSGTHCALASVAEANIEISVVPTMISGATARLNARSNDTGEAPSDAREFQESPGGCRRMPGRAPSPVTTRESERF